MANRWTAWIIGVAGVTLGVAIGFVAALLTRSDPVGVSPDASARLAASGDDVALSSRVDEILERLRRLEDAIRSRSDASAPASASPSPEPLRQRDDLRDWVEKRFDELEAEIRRTSVGLGELMKSKPTPDFAAVKAYGQEFAADARAAIRRIVGIDYRDAVLEFGSPTQKLTASERTRGLGGGRITTWVWELPEGGTLLYIDFESGTGMYAGVGDSTRLLKYLNDR